MNFISLILSIFLSITPSSRFICDNQQLNVKIINNQNGDFTIINDLEKLDSGAFVVLDWKVNLMLPRTFFSNEISFSDDKWKWIYEKENQVRLLERKRTGQVFEYKCEAREESSEYAFSDE